MLIRRYLTQDGTINCTWAIDLYKPLTLISLRRLRKKRKIPPRFFFSKDAQRDMAEYHRKDPDGHREYLKVRAVAARSKHADWLADIKSAAGCQICGEKDHRCLVFHHRDPRDKLFQITQNTWSRKQDILEAEIAKCDVLCANCQHRLLHKRK